MSYPITGGCFCGAIRYELGQSPMRVLMCHCVSCRKATGATRLAWAVVKNSDLHWLNHEPKNIQSSANAQRGFCANCGTSLTYRHANDVDTMDITLASFDHPEHFPPQADIWTADRLSWECSLKGALQFSEDI